jgi:hypothetical protein
MSPIPAVFMVRCKTAQEMEIAAQKHGLVMESQIVKNKPGDVI